jgi:hypothetical protein
MYNCSVPYIYGINNTKFMSTRGGKRDNAGRKAGITQKGMEIKTISIRVEKCEYDELHQVCIEAIKENLTKKGKL